MRRGWFSSSRDSKGQSYPVEYYLESVEEYSEGKIQKSEPNWPRNGNVNTVDFVIQARGNTRISRAAFVYNERARKLQLFTHVWASCLENGRKKYTFTN